MTLPNLVPLMPEIFVLIMGCLILLIDSFLTDKNRFVTYGLTQLTVLVSIWLTISVRTDGVVHLFNNMFVADALSDILKLATYIAVAMVLVYSRNYLRERGIYRGEVFVLILFAMLGMMIMISASHFLTLYLGLELLSLCLYALVALQRDSAIATEAAMKYFVLGALSSGMLLYGMSLMYGVTGTLEIGALKDAIQAGVEHRRVLSLGLVFVIAGLSFKLGVVPFHMWIPDVYQGAPTAITLFIASAPKIAAFAFFIRLLISGLQGLTPDWQAMLIIMAVLSIALGNITAIAQTNLKRMLAYSTISHMGFLLLGFLSGTFTGIAAAMFYVIAYVLMTLGTFGMILLLSRQGFEAENLEDFRGLNQRSPWYAFVMLLLMFSMAGIPPTIGFYAKLLVLQATVQAGFVWLAVVAVLFSVIGAFYYLRIIKLMYFDAPNDTHAIRPQADVSLLMSANGLSMLALGVLPQPLMALCIYAMQHARIIV